jgi:2-oxoglutarate ferredoxin oxidoreductase subunit beta
MEKIYAKTKLLTDTPLHYCPGCAHGIVHKMVAEVIEELGISKRIIAIGSIGCSGQATKYFNCDMIQPPHGRAPAVASAVKRCKPDAIVFTYQGDGDLAAIGCGEINNAVARGEKLTTIFINNTVFGMTGGQMAPTTLVGQRTTTTQRGRQTDVHGFPMHVSELLSQHEGAYYIERVSVDSTANLIKAKKAIKHAFQNQIDGKGYNLVELLCNCPTGWGMDPVESMEHIRKALIPVYPLGVYKDKDKEEKK